MVAEAVASAMVPGSLNRIMGRVTVRPDAVGVGRPGRKRHIAGVSDVTVVIGVVAAVGVDRRRRRWWCCDGGGRDVDTGTPRSIAVNGGGVPALDLVAGEA